MMRTLFNNKFFALVAFSLTTIASYAQFELRGGPYLQEVTSSEATVVFEPVKPTFSWVEVRKQGTTGTQSFFNDINGAHQIYVEINAPTTAVPSQNFAIRLKGLQKATTYEYRICSQVVSWMAPYKASVGETSSSEWYTFRTLDDAATEHHLLVISDMHHQPNLLRQMLQALDHETADHIIYAGDMMDNMQMGATVVKTKEEPYESFINTSVELFATGKPFEMVRGDNETKGDISRHFGTYFPYRSGRYYNAYRWGDLEIVMLDGGEAEADGSPTARVTNLAAFNAYREEQAEWFRQLMQTDEFRNAKYRIVVSHLPLPNDVDEDAALGTSHFSSLMTPLLNEANVDLVVCGHRHPDTFVLNAKGTREAKFASLIQGQNSALRIDIADGHLNLRIVDATGKVLHDKKLKRRKF